jgi:hypothetical protein|tara:strand:+ start:236 stop:1036 length:801 start_codon:yes stop_codon:yes gene_type:complete
MAIQYSLSYDADGNPSLVKNTVQGQAPVIKTDFNIGAYEPRRTVSTDYTFTSSEDPFSEESQLKILKTYIAENDSDPNTFAGDPRSRDMLTAMDKDKMARLAKFTGKGSAMDYEKYATRSATAKDIRSLTNTIGLLSSNPLTTILGTGARVVENYSDRQITKLMDNVYASQEYQDYMKNLDYEYDAYQDYDVYNDFQGGPNYRDDKGYLDVRPGTVFDAEDEETDFTPSSPPPAYDFDDSMGDSGNNQDTASTAGDAPDYSGPSPF